MCPLVCLASLLEYAKSAIFFFPFQPPHTQENVFHSQDRMPSYDYSKLVLQVLNRYVTGVMLLEMCDLFGLCEQLLGILNCEFEDGRSDDFVGALDIVLLAQGLNNLFVVHFRIVNLVGWTIYKRDIRNTCIIK